MSCSDLVPSDGASCRIRVAGTVQGVGFRPYVWQLANRYGLAGWVRNDGAGVLIEVTGRRASIDNFLSSLQGNPPPLAAVSSVHVEESGFVKPGDGFVIVDSSHSPANTGLPADAATCEHCVADITTPGNRRFGYPFTNCTHCGPRLSIVEGIPYDRAQTTMRDFAMCSRCRKEYEDPANRRFHAQPNACPDCGPQCWLETDGGRAAFGQDVLARVVDRLRLGQIIAIKGIGGFHLAVDASNAKAVHRLRLRKRRPAKPFALMARDLAQIERYCFVDAAEAQVLCSAAAPVVLLQRRGERRGEDCLLAPRQRRLGFILPYSPLHHLLLSRLDAPLVMTSGNRSSEPQCIDNDDARSRLADIADAWLMHDRDIANRVDDSVLRVVAGKPRLLRRARGYAPEPMRLPNGFSNAPDLLAMGGELKNTFCLLQQGRAVLSQHIGDLGNHPTVLDYEQHLQRYSRLFQHVPEAIVVDKHPEYRSRKLGIERANRLGLPLIEVQHHHAHLAACLAENGLPMETEPVLGLILDGLGYGDDGGFWGCEILLADYRDMRRLATLRAAPLPGGERAIVEPWRNLWAQLSLAGLLERGLPTVLDGKPLATLAQMVAHRINSPLASSAGRLFDAVAAAVGICSDGIQYEGQAAIELESLQETIGLEEPYPFLWREKSGLHELDPAPMWERLLDDLDERVAPAIIARRFHLGLAQALASMARRLIEIHRVEYVVLSGGVMQNHTLRNDLERLLSEHADVLTHAAVPANDGGLALGQAVVAAARLQQ